MYIPKIDDYLKILTDEEVEDFATIHFSEYFKSIREEQNLREVARSHDIFLTTPGKVEKYLELNSCNNCMHLCHVKILNMFNPVLQLINTKPNIDEAFKSIHQSIMAKKKNHTCEDWIVTDVIIK